MSESEASLTFSSTPPVSEFEPYLHGNEHIPAQSLADLASALRPTEMAGQNMLISEQRLEAAAKRRHARLEAAKIARSERHYDSRRHSDTIEIYKQQLERYPLLTTEQETELAIKIEKGKAASQILSTPNVSPIDAAAQQLLVDDGLQAKELFICSNLRMVLGIAVRFRRPMHPEFPDIVQQGNLGLEHAVDKFDYTKGFKFYTYGKGWVHQSIIRYLKQKSGLVRIPEDRFAQHRAALEEQERVASQTGLLTRLPKQAEHTENMMHIASLNAPLDDSEKLVEDVIHNEDTPTDLAAISHVDGDALIKAINQLPDLEREVLWHSYGLGGKVIESEELGKMLGRSSSSVRSLNTKARRSLKEIMLGSGFEY